ncbi:putative bifunctional diguanylate cyclase/phosphodiesterase [Marinobacter salicampi]|uniref:putative bifunctional diguanylate cyclase/phosphodiesterase n=1 Tax=Marinobacter salicampi TaxID=435907 RepID=UPI0014087FF5|nr:EAL domain-containing protein [Marinobacter salicampi]
MKLVCFIQTEMEQLLEDWADAALEIAPELRDENIRVLEDHARAMLEFIIEDLSTSQSHRESARKALGKGKDPISVAAENHGTGRLKQGLSILQVIQELRALRARVIEVWVGPGGLTAQELDELVRFNEAVDQLIANSVSSYSNQKKHESRLFEAMLRVTPDPSAIFDAEGKLLILNAPMAELISTPARDAIGKTPLELGLGFATEVQDAIVQTVMTGQCQRSEFRCTSPSGREFYFDCQLVPVFNDQNEVEAVAKTSRDITDRKKVERQVWRNANFDSLTGVPNRRLFLDRLEQNLLEAKRKNSSFALLFLDLDRFKEANDQLGHKAGDRLLEKVANRISANVRAMDTVARLGGDEFILILKDTNRDGAREAAKALLASLEEPFDVNSHRVSISGSIGLTLFPDDGTDADQLMHNADQAMYIAKDRGGHRVKLYRPWMTQRESDHMRLNRELDEALNDDQLEVYYQPIIDIRSGAIAKAEALLRWNHPEKGLLTPAAFLTIAEQGTITDRINAFVLEQAVASSLQWRAQGGEGFPININESPSSFFTRSLVDQWQTRLTQSDLDESRITMELSPVSLSNIRGSGFNPASSFGLAGLRLRLAIDDFGIEPFSLLALQELQVDSIKVDRDLVKSAGQGGSADRILKAIIAMAHAIDIEVVAAGVEQEQQLDFLSHAGCDYAQGFLFSKPLCRNDFGQLMM